MKKCECGLVIDGRSDPCLSCRKKAEWKSGVFAAMVDRSRCRLRFAKPGPYIIDYETMTAAGWPLLRPAPALARRIVLRAEVVPWSSVVGQAVTLIGQDGAVVAILAVRPQNTDAPKERARQIANEIVALVSVGGFWD